MTAHPTLGASAGGLQAEATRVAAKTGANKRIPLSLRQYPKGII